MIKPYIFDIEVEDPEDNEFLLFRVEAESLSVFHVYEDQDKLVDFHRLPDESKTKILEKIEYHFFMEDAHTDWGRE